ncbi:MAG: cyclic nucleotide-binding domain-containing protein [Rubrivivax sp.]|nr:cyclic nucleotide-binding domain-containing protein [Rubrivivax sp.]
MPPADGVARLVALWSGGRLAPAVDAAALTRLADHLDFVHVDAGRALIVQDEPGDFLLVVLDGSVGIDRAAAADPAHLGEARPGDVIGEMAVLDAGPRVSTCVTRTPCALAVLEAAALQRLMNDEPRLALLLLAGLARRLSLRLRHASTRLAALLGDG